MRKIFLVIFIGLFLFSATAFAQRMVLFEQFTNTGCGPCVSANNWLDNWYPNHYDEVSIIRYHVWWPSSTDPFYLANTTENQARTNYYGVNAVPDAQVDGVLDGGSSYTGWEALINQRLPIPNPVEFEVFGSYNESSRTGNATINVTAIEDFTYSNLRFHFVVIENDIYYVGPNGHPIHHQVMRDMIPNAGGEGFNISNGETVSFQRDFTISPDWDPDNCEIVIFVQDNVPGNAEVHQSYHVGIKNMSPPSFIEGYVTDQTTGEPISAAVYSEGQPYRTNANENGYYRLYLAPGTHTLMSDYFGYYTYTGTSTVVDTLDSLYMDIEMDPLPTVTLEGNVSDINGDPIETATVKLLGVPVDATQTDEEGNYIFNIPGDFDYTMKVQKAGYDIFTRDIYLSPTGVEEDFILYGSMNFEYSDGGFTSEADLGTDDWEWGIPTEAGGPPGDYDPDGEKLWGTNLTDFFESGSIRNLITPEYYIEGTEAGVAYLKFYHVLEVKEGWDGGYISISVEGEDWEKIEPVEGYPNSVIIGLAGEGSGYATNINNWTEARFDLTDYIGHDVAFRFRFGSTNTNNKRGWFIDHFVIYGAYIEPDIDPTDVEDDFVNKVPAHFSIFQNYPNPFNPTTQIRYTLPYSAQVDLKIYDVNGRLIKTLVSNRKSEGYHSVIWNGKDDNGEEVSSGVYFYRINAGDYAQTKQCLLLK